MPPLLESDGVIELADQAANRGFLACTTTAHFSADSEVIEVPPDDHKLIVLANYCLFIELPWFLGGLRSKDCYSFRRPPNNLRKSTETPISTFAKIKNIYIFSPHRLEIHSRNFAPRI